MQNKRRKKRDQAIEDTVTQWNSQQQTQKISSSLDENIAISKQLFVNNDIIRFRDLHSAGESPIQYFLLFCDGLVDSEVLNDNIVTPLMEIIVQQEDSILNTLMKNVVGVGEIKSVDEFKSVIEAVTSGDTVLFIEGCDQAIVLNTKYYALRSISEPENEKVLVGPREGFIEGIMQNLSQVVRRVRTNKLKVKMLTMGKQTQTKVCICYIDNLADMSVMQELLKRLDSVNIDGILDTNYITELIRDNRFSMFRSTGYSERPDVIVGKLLEGRIAIFVDGSPMVLTIPYLFIENFQSNEDYYFNFYYTTFSRLLRIFAFGLTIAIPGFFIATEAFHQQMLPLQLLIRIAMERQKVPLPASVEAVFMLIVFELLLETGVRMPSNIGQTLSIVGALVIGQAAVEASLVAAPMIIVVAFTGITGLLVPKLNSPIIFCRFFLLFMASVFGFFGLVIGSSLLVIHINNLTSFGVEQTSLEGRFNFQSSKDILIRAPWHTMIKRPAHLTANETRQTGGERR